MVGGTNEIHTHLALKGVDVDTTKMVELGIPFKAYDAGIKYAAILSYKWLAKAGALINPTRHGLLFHEEGMTIWVAGETEKSVASLEEEEIDTTKMGPAQPKKKRRSCCENWEPDWEEIMRRQGLEEEVKTLVHQLQTWPLSAGQEPANSEDIDNPGDALEDSDVLDGESLLELAQKLSQESVWVNFVKGFVTPHDPVESPTVEAKRKAIFAEFANTVFSGKTTGNPPVRGPMGEAEINLKPGAVRPCGTKGTPDDRGEEGSLGETDGPTHS